MVSFDVVSLFTNVPLEETIDMIGNYIYKENNPTPPAFEKDVFVKLMRRRPKDCFCIKTHCINKLMASPWAAH